MSAALIASVAAAAPVVHAGPAEDALDRVRRAVPGAGALVPRDWISVTSEPAGLVEGGPGRACDGAAPEPLADVVASAWSSFLYGDNTAGIEAIERTLAALPCFAGPVDPVALGGLHALLGLLRLHAGDEPGALAAWRDARSADPGAAPPSDWPVATAERFRAFAPAETVPLVLVVPGLEVTIDGHPAGAAVTPGRHLVQSTGAGWLLEVPEVDRATIVIPSAFAGQPLDALLAEPERLSLLLAVVFGEGSDVFVVTDTRLARMTAGRPEVAFVEEPVPDEVVAAAAARTRRRTAGAVVGVSGGAVALLGAGGAVAVSVLASNARADYAVAADPEEARDLRQRFTASAAWVAPAEWTLAGGALVGAIGLAIVVAP